MKLPTKFTKDGVLPVGDYELTPDELLSSILVNGPKSLAKGRRWNVDRRLKLAKNAIALIDHLWQAGIQNVFLDGSFVEDKDKPNDIDGYFDCDEFDFASGALERRLNRTAGRKIWDWDSRVMVEGFPKAQLRMWRDYRVEFFPNFGQLCGIRDDTGRELNFPEAFRRNRHGIVKGIIKVVPHHDSN